MSDIIKPNAFAALLRDDTLVTWGNAEYGGDSSAVQSQLAKGVKQVFPGVHAFAVLLRDDTLVTWGDPRYGGDSSAVQSQLAKGVKQVFPGEYAFAVLLRDDTLVTWGDAKDGGDSSAVQSQLAKGVKQVFPGGLAVAALLRDDTLVTWGDAKKGGDSSAVQSQLAKGVKQVFPGIHAFAALLRDDTLVTWGSRSYGGDSSAVQSQLAKGVKQVFPGKYAYAALLRDDTLVTWGDAEEGCDSSAVRSQLAKGITQVFPGGTPCELAHSDSVPNGYPAIESGSPTQSGQVATASDVSCNAAALRLLDAWNELGNNLLPLTGFEDTPELSLEEAGAKLVTTVTELLIVIQACQQLVQKRRADGLIPANISDDQACAIALYTAGWSDPEKSFFFILNGALRAEDRSKVKKFYAMLRLMVNGMKRLAPRKGTLYRGVKGSLAHLYQIHSIITWWAWSSCTTAIEALQNPDFLGTSGDRTLFIIEDAVGFNIKPFSWFQNEAEVVLPSGAALEVQSHLDAGNGLTMITLKMVRTEHCIMDLNTHLSPSGQANPTSIPEAYDGEIEGLSAVLTKAKLNEETCKKVLSWCKDQQAAELQEIDEAFEELATDCQLLGMPKSRLRKALSEALA